MTNNFHYVADSLSDMQIPLIILLKMISFALSARALFQVQIGLIVPLERVSIFIALRSPRICFQSQPYCLWFLNWEEALVFTIASCLLFLKLTIIPFFNTVNGLPISLVWRGASVWMCHSHSTTVCICSFSLCVLLPLASTLGDNAQHCTHLAGKRSAAVLHCSTYSEGVVFLYQFPSNFLSLMYFCWVV